MRTLFTKDNSSQEIIKFQVFSPGTINTPQLYINWICNDQSWRGTMPVFWSIFHSHCILSIDLTQYQMFMSMASRSNKLSQISLNKITKRQTILYIFLTPSLSKIIYRKREHVYLSWWSLLLNGVWYIGIQKCISQRQNSLFRHRVAVDGTDFHVASFVTTEYNASC